MSLYPEKLNTPRIHKPIPILPQEGVVNGQPSEEVYLRYNRELVEYAKQELLDQEQVLEELMCFYGIDREVEDRWERLARMLAQDHVGAMQLQSPPGRPAKWSGEDGILLLAKVYGEWTLTPEAKEYDIVERVRLRDHPYDDKETFNRGYRKSRASHPEVVKFWEEARSNIHST